MSRPSHLVLATCALLAAAPAGAADTPRSVWDGAYNAAQVKRGNAAYVQLCETCHGPSARVVT